MASDAHGEHGGVDLELGESLLDEFVPLRTQLVRAGVGGLDDELALSLQTGELGLQRVDQLGLGGLGTPYLLIGVQLAGLELKDGLQVQCAAQQSSSGRDPAAFFQIVEGVHHDVDLGVERGLFQALLDLRAGLAPLPQSQRVQHRLALGSGDALVVSHKHPALIGIVAGQAGGIADVSLYMKISLLKWYGGNKLSDFYISVFQYTGLFSVNHYILKSNFVY